MPTNSHPSTAPAGTNRAWWAPIAGLLAASLATVLVACGGGGGSSAGVGTGGTGSFAVGSVSGFGSVIVNGVRYDSSNASVLDDDGNASDSSALSIGQVVEVRGSVNSDGVTGTASSVSYFAELKGPVTAVDAGAGTVTVFTGELVSVSATTVFKDTAGLSDLAVGNVVKVYGLPDASGAVAATRIERLATSIAAFSGEFRVRGLVSDLVSTSPGQRFSVGSVTVQVTSANQVDGTIANGVLVNARLNKTAAGDGSYAAVRVQVKTRTYAGDVKKAQIEGLVSEFTSSTAPFKVNGYPVQLDPSATYQNGVAGDLANGVRIEAKGSVTSGVLVISKVEFANESNDGGGDGNSAPFEFHDVATCTVTPCGNPAGAIVVRGVTVQYDSSTRFSGLSTASLNGAKVEVKAIAQSGVSGTTLLATRIQRDN